MNSEEIAKRVVKKEIREIAEKLDLDDNLLSYYGKDKAKIYFNDVMKRKKGKLILVTGINPTPYGEGKTTVAIGLVDAFKHLGKDAIGALREPSLGPIFGIKGGATGDGYSQLIPREDINLHFTGDFHAITSANNLISAAIDNIVFHGNKLNIDPNEIVFKRCLDVNDRSLRDLTINSKVSYETSFDITAASEVMSIFCLSTDYDDLKTNLENIFIAKDLNGNPLYVRDLNISGSLMALLKDAFNPNLVQTLENNPVLVHGGPFANVSHGCSSIVSTNLALQLADYVITEAGFGADLGAEKFLNIKCQKANLKPDCIVIVATIRALKHNGNLEDERESLIAGLPNLGVHIENMKKFTSNVIVCLNEFSDDTDEEIGVVKNYCNDKLVKFATSEAYLKGGLSTVALANKIVEISDLENDFKPLYDFSESITTKIEKVCKEIYRASSISYSEKALRKIEYINNIKEDELPICIAKTQYSISDDPKKLGYPKDFDVLVRDIELRTGAGFITVFLGEILTMPGLSKTPNYEKIYLDNSGEIIGI